MNNKSINEFIFGNYSDDPQALWATAQLWQRRVIMNNNRNPDHAYARALYDALEDLSGKVRNSFPVMPRAVKSSLAYADYTLARARKERNKEDQR